MQEMENIQLIRNPHGIKVKKCCLSCHHKTTNLAGTCFCSLHGNVRLKKNKKAETVCDDWQLSEKVSLAGHSRGRIKKKDYLEFALNSMLADESKTVEQIRGEYGGRIFLNEECSK